PYPPLPTTHSLPTRRSSDLVHAYASIYAYANIYADANPDAHANTNSYTGRMLSQLRDSGRVRCASFSHYRLWRYRARLACALRRDRKSKRLNSSHEWISYAV